MRECLGKHSCTSSPFPIAILNGAFGFRSVKAMNNWKRSAIKQILLLLVNLLLWFPSYSSVEDKAGVRVQHLFWSCQQNLEFFPPWNS